MYTVDIDTGGTMTDGLVWDGTTMVTVKVDTTPHDLTVSFRELLGEAASRLGFGRDLGAFLDEVSLIRWSSTITSNTLAERKGAKLGLLVRPGSERSLYGDGPSPAVGTLVAERNVVGIGADAGGQSADAQGVLDAVRRLLEDGARRICVSLDSFPETRQEQAVKRIVESQYRDHYLGSVPVLLASDMAQVDDGQTRTHCALINAYVHSQLATSLFKAEDMLRYDEGWTGALLVGHTNGGVARVGKTKAVRHDRVRTCLRHACRRVVRPAVRTGPGRVPRRRRDHRQGQRGAGRPAPLHPRRQRIRHPGLHSSGHAAVGAAGRREHRPA